MFCVRNVQVVPAKRSHCAKYTPHTTHTRTPVVDLIVESGVTILKRIPLRSGLVRTTKTATWTRHHQVPLIKRSFFHRRSSRNANVKRPIYSVKHGSVVAQDSSQYVHILGSKLLLDLSQYFTLHSSHQT